MTMNETDSVPVLGRILTKQFVEFVRLRFSGGLPVPAFIAATNSGHALVTFNVLNKGSVPASFKVQGSNADPIDYESTIRIPVSAAGGNAVDQVTLELSGNLVAASTFGFWSPSVTISLIGAQLSAQDAPVGAAAILEVYKNGVATGKTTTIADGQSTANVTFSGALAVAAGDILTLRVNQVGSGTPGAFVTAILTYNNSTAASPDVVVWTTTVGGFSASFVDIAGTAFTAVPGGTVNFEFSGNYRFLRLIPTADGGLIRVDGASSSAIAIVATDPQLRN